MKSLWCRTLITTLALTGMTFPLAARADDEGQQKKEVKVVAEIVDGVLTIVEDEGNEQQAKPQIQRIRLRQADEGKGQIEKKFEVKVVPIEKAQLKVENEKPHAKVIRKAIMIDSEGNMHKIDGAEHATIIIVQHDGKVLRIGGDKMPKLEAKQIQLQLTQDKAAEKTIEKIEKNFEVKVTPHGDAEKVLRYEVQVDGKEGSETKEVRIHVVGSDDQHQGHKVIKLDHDPLKSEGATFHLHADKLAELHEHAPQAIVIKKEGKDSGGRVEVEVIKIGEGEGAENVFMLKGDKADVLKVQKAVEDHSAAQQKEGKKVLQHQVFELREAKDHGQAAKEEALKKVIASLKKQIAELEQKLDALENDR